MRTLPASANPPSGRMLDAVWPSRDRHPGHALAVLSAALLGVNALLLVGMAAGAVFTLWNTDATVGDLLTRMPFPVLVYAAWGLSVFGSAGAICAVSLYGYRERWFWRWMILAAATWLLMPPVHAVIGVVALAALLHHRSHFVTRQAPDAAPPQ